MINYLPCDCHDCINHDMGFCKLTYPILDYIKIDNKMHVECTDYKENNMEENNNE